MKIFTPKYLLSILCLLCCMSCFATISQQDEAQTTDDVKIENGTYPYECDTLRVLVIGNSYVNDGIAYLKKLMANLEVDANRVVLGALVHGASSFQDWIDHINENSIVSTKEAPYYNVIIGDDGVDATTVQEVLSAGWDIVLLQQDSNISGNFTTFLNSKEYVELLRQYTSNENLCIFYHIPYGHSKAKNEVFGSSDWKKYAATAQKIVEMIGIDKLVPTGTAIQKARNTELTYGGLYDNLTRDNWHVNSGTGRYIAACTWYEALFAPYFGVSVINSTLDILETEKPNDKVFADSFVAVNDNNRELCIKCAIYAIQEPYSDSVDCFTDNPVITASDETSYIYGYDNTIFIEGVADDTIVRIYNAGGMLLHTTTAARVSHITLPDGLYLVQANNKVQKIAL